MSGHAELQHADSERWVRSQSDADLCRRDHAGELSAELLGDADLDGDRSLRQRQHVEPNHHGRGHHSADDWLSGYRHYYRM